MTARDLVAAYDDGVEGLAAAVGAAIEGERGWVPRLSAGLRGGLDFLAADPALARLLLVESLAADSPVRLEHERSLARLAKALRPPRAELAAGAQISEETARLLAGGLASRLSGQVLAGEVESLPESHDLLLRYLLTALLPDAADAADERRATSS